ncbi:hypothetical protein XA68_16678 [Ophiocordyceps unilateralis]|uniref:DNA mismatch repair protein S5 domain-containing protein n=1 Tax=Ophiocordyceps unilateralis TaxID=268505 RepID=A0A2A9PJY0_OPHUN|nr:hypothetical protein XA68_16678 [Ophiocordyceps unilateralis]
MPIHPLPPSTVRLLGASVTISCPCDLVKELLDNAIDASATAVDVIVASDTLSSLSVRDNGHGIAPTDFESLGRRAHTSKLRNLDELQARPGKTLGFRGEALAAANAVARLTIVTRAAGEPVASRLQLPSPDGRLQSCGPVSAPVGTAVHVARLFDCMPARRQHLLGERGRSMSAIKRLLQSYALARPYLKLSFKVVDDGTQSWRYSPNHSPTVNEAALQIFGKNVATSCTQLIFPGSPSEPVTGRPPGFVLDAFVPRPDCNAEAVRGVGLFVSVDQRPLSPTKELPKKIASALKSHIVNHLGAEPGKGFFMRLDIRCPPRSYDPNVTPLKDDVLFADEEAPLECFEDLCRQLYGGGMASNSAGSPGPDSLPMPLSLPDDDHPDISSSPLNDADILSLLEDTVPNGPSPNVDQDLVESGLMSLKQRIEPPCPHPNDGGAPKSDQPNSTGAGEKSTAPSAHVKMRMLGRVDMARSDSNATDDSGTIELTGVVIPPRPAKPPATAERHLQARKADGIHRYFRPSQEQDFEIACDDTATPEEPASSRGAQPVPRPQMGSRPPLQLLKDPALNRLQEESEVWSSFSSADEGDALRPDVPPQVLESPFLSQLTDDDDDEGGGERRSHPISSPPAASYVQNLTPNHGPSVVRLSDGLVPFPTPPSSGRIRGAEPNALGRPLMGRRGRGSRGRPRARGGFAQGATRPAIGSSIRPRINRSMAGSPGVAEAAGSGPGLGPPMQSGNQLRLNFTNRKSPSPISAQGWKPPAQSGGYGQTGGHPESADEATSHGADLSLAKPRHVNKPYSHTMQALLMRTPSPERELELGDAAGQVRGRRISGTETPHQRVSLWDDGWAGGGSDAGTGQNVARRERLKKPSPEKLQSKRPSPRRSSARGPWRRGRSSSRKLSARSQSWKRLSLEATAEEARMHATARTLHVSCDDVQRHMKHLIGHDSYVGRGHLAEALPIEDMADARTINDGLQVAVEAWMAKSKTKVDVDLKLLLEVKGKRR